MDGLVEARLNIDGEEVDFLLLIVDARWNENSNNTRQGPVESQHKRYDGADTAAWRLEPWFLFVEKINSLSIAVPLGEDVPAFALRHMNCRFNFYKIFSNHLKRV